MAASPRKSASGSSTRVARKRVTKAAKATKATKAASANKATKATKTTGAGTHRSPAKRSKTRRGQANPNTYECDVCGWLYQPEQYHGIDIDEQDADWVCPECEAEPNHFQLVVPQDELSNGAEEPEVSSAFDPARRAIYTNSSDPSILTLKSRYDRGRLITRPDFQRYEVWTDQKKSKLIESILLYFQSQ